MESVSVKMKNEPVAKEPQQKTVPMVDQPIPKTVPAVDLPVPEKVPILIQPRPIEPKVWPVCNIKRDYRCTHDTKFSCGEGFVPICGSLKGYDSDRAVQVVKSKGDCENRCKQTAGCRGYEFVIKAFNSKDKYVVEGTCRLNPTCPNTDKRVENIRTCYKKEVPIIPYHCDDGSSVEDPKDCPIMCLDGKWEKRGECKCESPTCDTAQDYKCPASQTFQCAPGYKPICGALTGLHQDSIEYLVLNKDECRKKCDASDKCYGYEFFFPPSDTIIKQSKALCKLNRSCVNNTMDVERQNTCYKDVMEFQKYTCGDGSKVEDKSNCPEKCYDGTWMKKGHCPPCKIKADFLCEHKNRHACPDDFYPVCGDLSGWGISGQTLRTKDRGGCAKLCNVRDECLGFEFGLIPDSNGEGYCNLNPTCPNEPQTSSQHTCYKKTVGAEGYKCSDGTYEKKKEDCKMLC